MPSMAADRAASRAARPRARVAARSGADRACAAPPAAPRPRAPSPRLHLYLLPPCRAEHAELLERLGILLPQHRCLGASPGEG
eukprot:scaffold63071_cov54-Phaeocystis_antarctica.AAC.3